MSHDNTRPVLSIRLLGPLEIEAGAGGTPSLSRKTRAILAYLAATDQTHSRRDLYHLFCRGTQDPAGTLRWHLSRLRRQLPAGVLLEEGEYVAFNRDVARVDCVQFQALLSNVPTALDPRTLVEAAALYRGDFLDDLSLADAPEFDVWILGRRARFARLYARALTELIRGDVARQAYDDALRRAQELVQKEPLLEEAHAALIWLYAVTGRRRAALEQYEQCRRLLEEELAVEPTPELQALHSQIVAGTDPGPFPLGSAEGAVSTAEPGRLETPQPAFVGRENDLATLERLWHAARRGEGSPGAVLLVEAAAGGGKTRLLAEFSHRLDGGLFLFGRCYESSRTLPYHPWIELLEQAAGYVDDDSLARLPVAWQDYLPRLVPGLARRLDRPLSSATPITTGDAAHLFAAVAGFLFEGPGARRPLLVFVDDLQWADEASLHLFHALSRKLSRPGVLLVGAFRPEEVDDSPELQALLADLDRDAAFHLRLDPLSEEAVEQIMVDSWPELPPGFRPHVAAMVTRATGGNPLFVTEVLRELSHTPDVPLELPVPASVLELVRRRLRRFAEGGRQALQALAILDMPCLLDEICQASARSEEESVQALDRGLQLGLLRAQSAGHEMRYDFSHDLVCRAVRDLLSDVRRRSLHRRAARVLEGSGARPAAVAYHWRMAGLADKEAYYAILAGEQAADLYANEEAVRYLQRALSLVDEPERQLQIMEKLGDVLLLVGDWDKADSLFREALAIAEADENWQRLAHFQNALGQLLSRKGLYSQALSWLEKARGSAELSGDRRRLAGSVGTMGIVYWQMDDYDRALACYLQALEIETEVENRAGIAIWTGNIGSIYHQWEEYDQALVHFERSLQLRRELGMKREAGIETGNIGNVYSRMGDHQKALEYHLEALQIRRELGDKAGEATVLGLLGEDYAQLGHEGAALICLQVALQLNLQLGNWEGIALQLGRMGQLLGDEGRQEQAVACLDRSLTLFRRLGAPYYLSRWLVAKAEVMRALGQYGAAQKLNDEALTMAESMDRAVEFSARLLVIVINVGLGRWQRTRAREALQTLAETSDEPAQQAAIAYELWRLAPEDEVCRQEAVERYHALLTSAPNVVSRRRYHELTGDTWAVSGFPTSLPDWVDRDHPALDEILEKVDETSLMLE